MCAVQVQVGLDVGRRACSLAFAPGEGPSAVGEGGPQEDQLLMTSPQLTAALQQLAELNTAELMREVSRRRGGYRTATDIS
jgi:hypothetical protein